MLTLRSTNTLLKIKIVQFRYFIFLYFNTFDFRINASKVNIHWLNIKDQICLTPLLIVSPLPYLRTTKVSVYLLLLRNYRKPKGLLFSSKGPRLSQPLVVLSSYKLSVSWTTSQSRIYGRNRTSTTGRMIPRLLPSLTDDYPYLNKTPTTFTRPGSTSWNTKIILAIKHAKLFAPHTVHLTQS